MSLATTYYLSVVLASIGVIQIIAIGSLLHGILFVPNGIVSRLIGAIFIALGFGLFFGTGPQHLPDTSGGLDGNSQASFFALGSLTGIAMTFLISSLINMKRYPYPEVTRSGLDILRNTTYLKAVFSLVKTKWTKFYN